MNRLRSGELTHARVEELLERVARALERQERARGHDRGPLVVKVAAFLVENPDASANRVALSVPGRREDVLWAVRELRAASPRFRTPGNRQPGLAANRDLAHEELTPA